MVASTGKLEREKCIQKSPLHSHTLHPRPAPTIGPLQSPAFWRRCFNCPAEHFQHILCDLDNNWVWFSRCIMDAIGTHQSMCPIC